MVNSPPRPPSSTPTSGPAHRYTGPSRLYLKQKEIRAGPDSGSPVSRNPFTSGLRGSFPSRVQSLGDSCTRTPFILPPSTNLFSSVPAYGVTHWASGLIPLGRLYLRPLQRHFHSLGLTNRFTPLRRSDPLVLANLLPQWQDLCFLTSGIPIRTFQADFTIFKDASTQGLSAHMGDSQISDTWTRTDRKLHISCLELKAVGSALKHWVPMLQGHQVMIATDNSTVVFVYQQTRWDPCPHLVTFDSRASPLIRGSEHNSLSEASRLFERDSRPPISSESANIDRVVPPPRDHETYLWGTPEVDMFATVSNSHLPWFMSPIPEPRDLAVDALSQDWQGRSMHMFPPFSLLDEVIQKL